MTLKNNRAPLLSNIKLYASFHRNMWIQTGAGLGSIQFRNWNCSSIPIPIPELELELKLVELKMELQLKTLELELELKTGIDFLVTATAAITS